MLWSGWAGFLAEKAGKFLIEWLRLTIMQVSIDEHKQRPRVIVPERGWAEVYICYDSWGHCPEIMIHVHGVYVS